jgi:hypothetical protein
MDFLEKHLDQAQTDGTGDGYPHAQLEELEMSCFYQAELNAFIQDDDYQYTVYVIEPNQKKRRVR